MSGAEIIGLAASVIQIAELGGKLSVKTFTFARKVKNANKTIDALSQEIAVTGAVLQQLGETLSDNNSVKVCSQEAIDTAKKLVSDTEKVFRNLEKLLDDDEKASSKFRINLKRLKFPFLESEIEQVQANLERLKSSLLVILNVLIFAEQLRNRETLPILEDQRDLIRTLAAEKDANEQRYEQILRAIADRPKISVDDTDKNGKASDGSFDANSFHSTTLTLLNSGDDASLRSTGSAQPTSRRVTELPVIDLPEGLEHHHERIHNHTQLVHNLLTEIDCLEYKLEHSVRGRLQTGVLDIHWREWERQRSRYGNEPLAKIIASSTVVAGYWKDKAVDEQQQASPAEADNIFPGAPEELKVPQREASSIQHGSSRSVDSVHASAPPDEQASTSVRIRQKHRAPRTGCPNCTQRRVKCYGRKSPGCARCEYDGLHCEWERPIHDSEIDDAEGISAARVITEESTASWLIDPAGIFPLRRHTPRLQMQPKVEVLGVDEADHAATYVSHASPFGLVTSISPLDSRTASTITSRASPSHSACSGLPTTEVLDHKDDQGDTPDQSAHQSSAAVTGANNDSSNQSTPRAMPALLAPEVDLVDELLVRYTKFDHKEIAEMWWREGPEISVQPEEGGVAAAVAHASLPTDESNVEEEALTLAPTSGGGDVYLSSL